MKFKNVATAGAILVASAIALSGCASSTPESTTSATPSAAAVDYSALSGTITAGGSSAQANAQAAWTTAFTAQAKGVTINYDKSQGSGGGVTNWTAGSYDFAGSDSPLSEEQQTAATLCGPNGAINLPIYLDGVAIVYNLAGVDKLNLSAETLAKIFSLSITTWNDPAIAAENPDAKLPATAITTVTRSDGSGTTKTFTNFLSQTAKDVWTYPADSAWPIAGTSAQKGTSGIVQAVGAGDGTIGYADHSAIGELKAASVSVKGEDFVAFSPEAVTAAFDAAASTTDTGIEGDLAQTVDFTAISGAEAYPIPLVSYGILCTTFKDAKQKELATAYLGWIGSDIGQQVAAKNAGAAQIPEKLLTEIAASLALVK
ncbi:phosphate ABC transporter substrate-binding protein PstS [Agreia sp. Leaf210]|uniref:phosphate ABC transporter substrate-binding protein PstS n=1 Tax=Agreia sp. Leaf210 TaxID=1735682 RepID=UPI0007001866|nr:phosphate ABC transporter substrate-binding protein PstS [Agreia sp. Leaf210]KQM59058.1 phosphate-binding protein [Agreia sp. Leaf210]